MVVNSVDDPPRVVEEIPDQVVVESSASLEIDLTNVFQDPEGEVVTILGAMTIR